MAALELKRHSANLVRKYVGAGAVTLQITGHREPELIGGPARVDQLERLLTVGFFGSS